MLAGESIAIVALADDDADATTDDRVLGLLPTLAVLPHADTVGVERQHAWSMALGRPLLAVPEAGGVHVTGTTCTVLGPDPVHVVDGAGRVTYLPGDRIPLDGQ